MNDSVPEPVPEGGLRPGDPQLRRASIALLLAGITTFALLYSTQPLLPQLATAFHVSPAQSALSLSLATVTLAIGLLIAGPVSEVIGRRPVMLASLFGSAVIAVLCAAAPNWPALLAARAIEGLTLAGLPAVGVAYLREEVADSAVGRVIGLYIGGNAIGGLSGRLICSALAQWGGWRAALLGIAVLGSICAVAVAILLPPSARFVPAPAGLRALGQRTAGALGDPVLLSLYLLGALIMACFVGIYNALGFRLEGPPYGLSTSAVGLVFGVYLFGTVSSTVAGQLVDRLGRVVVVPVSAALMLVGALVTLAHPVPVIILGLSILTIGFFGAHGVASGWVAARAHLAGRPVAQSASLYLVLYYVGSSIGGALSGIAWKSGGWPAVVQMASALAVASIVVSLLVGRGSRSRATALRETAALRDAARRQANVAADAEGGGGRQDRSGE
jgi:YNFM family putative membrane transporter